MQPKYKKSGLLHNFVQEQPQISTFKTPSFVDLPAGTLIGENSYDVPSKYNNDND